MVDEFVFCDRHDCADLHSYGPGIRDFYIVHYVINGGGTLIIDGRTYTITTGESFLIHPYENVSYYPNKNNPWEYVWINFVGERYQSILKKIDYAKDNCIIGYMAPQEILPYYEQLKNYNNKTSCQNIRCGLAMTILGIYADTFPKIDVISNDKLYYQYACTIIKNSYYKPHFKLEDICKELSISMPTLHRAFLKNCDVSPGVYLQSQKINYAKILLSKGVSVKETALSCGFSNPSYFSKAFKLNTGMSPTEYLYSKNVKKINRGDMSLR